MNVFNDLSFTNLKNKYAENIQGQRDTSTINNSISLSRSYI